MDNENALDDRIALICKSAGRLNPAFEFLRRFLLDHKANSEEIQARRPAFRVLQLRTLNATAASAVPRHDELKILRASVLSRARRTFNICSTWAFQGAHGCAS